MRSPLSSGDRWLSIDWDAWDNAAEAQMAALPNAIQPAGGAGGVPASLGRSPSGRALLVAVDDLEGRIDAWVRGRQPTAPSGAAPPRPRPTSTPRILEPRNEIERSLAEIWGEQLGIMSVGVQDRFLDLGGHSLLALQVASQIRDRFQIEMPALQMFQTPTVAELAPLVERAHRARRLGRRCA